MTQVPLNIQDLAGPSAPLQPAQRAILWPLCAPRENQRRVPRYALFAAAGLNDPDPVVNNYGLRRILGSITQRLNSPAWYRSVGDPTVPGGRWYLLSEDLRDGVRDILADHDNP